MEKSILIADEDSGVLTFLTLLFEEQGVRVLRARSRAEMLEILSRNYVPVDLVLANTVLAQLSCSDLEQDIARERGMIPVLWMSALVEAGVIRVELRKRFAVVGGAPVLAADESSRDMVMSVLSALVSKRSGAHA